MSVHGLREAVVAMGGALDDEGQSGSTCLAVLCGVVGVPVCRRAGLSEVVTSGLPPP